MNLILTYWLFNTSLWSPMHSINILPLLSIKRGRTIEFMCLISSSIDEIAFRVFICQICFHQKGFKLTECNCFERRCLYNTNRTHVCYFNLSQVYMCDFRKETRFFYGFRREWIFLLIEVYSNRPLMVFCLFSKSSFSPNECSSLTSSEYESNRSLSIYFTVIAID